MKHKIRSAQLGVLMVGVMAATNCGCGSGSAGMPPPPPAISVSLSAATVTVQPQATAQFTATINNDASAKGVTWSMTCNGATCGSISPSATASGNPATYTAPMPPVVTLIVTLTATSVADPTKVASVAITVPALPPAISVSVSPSSATVEAGGTQSFTATVTNDPANQGVTWGVAILFCRAFLGCHTSACTTGCGTFSPAGTSSGTPTTYTAPGKLAGTAFVVATSVTQTSATGRASLSVLPVSVSVSPTSASVALNATQTFTATLTNDATNSGVTWSLTQNGVACAPACGTVSPTNTASGALATYTAPDTQPTLPLVTLTATSVEGTTTGAAVIAVTTSTGALCADTGSEALLKGQYAFLLQGFDYNIAALAGSFTADGTGKITAGQIDLTHEADAGQLAGVAVETADSSYSVGPDHRGCLMLANASGGRTFFRFALGSINASNIATKGRMIEFDDTTGGGTRLTGTLRLQDPTSFSANSFNGAYAFGLKGQGTTGDPAVIAGIIDSDGVSAITAGSFDFNDGGKFSSKISFVPGTPFTCCSTNGRGTIGTGTLQDNGGAWVFNLTVYMINSKEAFLIGSVLYNPTNDCCKAEVALDIASGEAFAAPGPFSVASLNGPSVFRQTAQANTGAVFSTATANADIHIGSASADGAGTLIVNDNENNGGTFATASLAFTYAVASNGRVTLSGGSTPPVLYLTGQNAGILLGTNPNVDFGIIEPQTAGPFSDSSFSGAYILGNENPSAITITMQAGVVTADGNGNAAATSEQSSLTGLSKNQPLNLNYSFQANGVGNVGSGTTAILISGNKLVFINNTSGNPTITVVEK